MIQNYLAAALLRSIYHGMGCVWIIEMGVSFSALKRKVRGFAMNSSTYTKSKLTELFVSLPSHTKKFKIKDIIPLRYLWISDSADLLGGDSRMACKSIILFWPMEKLVATFW